MIKIEYDGLKGKSTKEDGYSISINEGGFAPYELLMSALSSCFYHTFINIAKKKQLKIGKSLLEVEYAKHTDKVPYFLKEATINIKIFDVNKDDYDKIFKSLELAAQYCSIYQTLSTKLGANLKWNLELA